MNDLLFNVPWWLPTMVATIGIAIFVSGNRRQHERLRSSGLALLLIGVAWATISYLVDTDKEKCEKATARMLQDVVARNWTDFKSLLSDEADFRVEGGRSRAAGAKDLTEYARSGCEGIQLRSATLRIQQTEQTGPLITVTGTITSMQDTAGVPVIPSTWAFDWERSSAGWRLREFRLIRIRDTSGAELEGFLPGH